MKISERGKKEDRGVGTRQHEFRVNQRRDEDSGPPPNSHLP